MPRDCSYSREWASCFAPQPINQLSPLYGERRSLCIKVVQRTSDYESMVARWNCAIGRTIGPQR